MLINNFSQIDLKKLFAIILKIILFKGVIIYKSLEIIIKLALIIKFLNYK